MDDPCEGVLWTAVAIVYAWMRIKKKGQGIKAPGFPEGSNPWPDFGPSAYPLIL